MTLEVEVFWSFRSPYSYLATPRIAEMAARYDLDVKIRPVYPLAVRVDGFFERQDPRWPMYVVRDVFREAQRLGMTFGPPRPDPIVMNMATREIAKDQPYIRRLTHLGQLAAEQGRGIPFICEVSRTIWGGETPGWDQGDHLAKAAERAGLDLARLDAQALAEAERIEAAIQASHARMDQVGHWGVPTFVFENEPFFGQDRIDTLIWRLEQHGLTAR
ncbi:2-hydroxychromene-2-carboxylate isomerase [Phenylobacterium sp.]|uniref:2-hydroxychromene-2-carboxylate isomerase n=1 Tax=Phenylobacterium sp. TaxID=1871053 RepID=UPI003D2890B1